MGCKPEDEEGCKPGLLGGGLLGGGLCKPEDEEGCNLGLLGGELCKPADEEGCNPGLFGGGLLGGELQLGHARQWAGTNDIKPTSMGSRACCAALVLDQNGCKQLAISM